MATRRRTAITLGLGLLVGCTAAPAPMPQAAELGDRVRIRIAGRDPGVPSITTADYFLSFVALGPDGQRKACRVYAPESAGSEGLSLSVGSRIFRAFDREGWPDLGETRHGDPRLCEDLVLPPGVSLCFEPGTCFAYRIVDRGRRWLRRVGRRGGEEQRSGRHEDGVSAPAAGQPMTLVSRFVV